MAKIKIKKGDTVAVITGKDRGKTGKVLSVFPRKSLILVEGVNIKKRHQRPRKENQKGQIVDKTLPFHISNVMIVDPETKKPTRIRMETKGGEKSRVAKSGAKLS